MSSYTRKPSEHDDQTVELKDQMEDTKRLNANIPESLHAKIRIEAARRGISITDIIIGMLYERYKGE